MGARKTASTTVKTVKSGTKAPGSKSKKTDPRRWVTMHWSGGPLGGREGSFFAEVPTVWEHRTSQGIPHYYRALRTEIENLENGVAFHHVYMELVLGATSVDEAAGPGPLGASPKLR